MTLIEAGYYAGRHRSQYDGSPLANQNCTPTSGANGARAATGGRIDRSGGQIRALVAKSEETNPLTPGWSLPDLDLAMERLGVPFEIRAGGWAGVVAAHEAGLFVALQGDSDQFADATCSGAFDGDHCVGLHPGTYADGTWPLADPICPARRPEQPATLRAYAELLGGTAFRFGVFSTPVPKEGDMDIRSIKGEDWTPKASPGGTSNGVLRPSPQTSAPVLVRVPLGTVVRSIAEIRIAAVTDVDWRLTEYNGQPAYMLRRDWDPLVPGGDPAVDAELSGYIARQAPVDAQAVAEAEYRRVTTGTTARAEPVDVTITFPPAP